MTTNADIKRIRSLSEKKFRDSAGLFVVEGEKMVQEALTSGFEVVEVVRREDVGEAVMSRLSHLTTAPPVLAVLRIPQSRGYEVGKRLYLALDSVRDPGNMGTIIRLADWFGIKTVFASRDSVDIYNPKVVQATMGAIFRVNVQYADIPGVCHAFRAAGMPVYGTFLDGCDIYAQDLQKEGLIVMGNESNGISAEVGALVSSRLLIPSFAEGPTAESLNVAVATAITLSEFRRR